MPRLKNRLPRMYRDRGLAYVKINGQRLRLGPWGSDQAEEEYRRLMAEWVANGRRLPAATIEPAVEEASVTEVFVAYLKEARNRYDGDLAHVRAALKAVRQFYGSEPAPSFGPKRLRVVRQQMIEQDLARRTINKRVNWIRTAFKWAASHELCDERVHRRLATVPGLRPGEGGRETERIKPVPRRDIRLARRQMTRPVRGLVNLQLLTGARAGELVGLRATDIDTTGAVWTFKPSGHKTAHHGHERTIYFGPRAQRVLRAFMRPGRLDRPLFSPRDALAETMRRRRTSGQGRRAGQKPGGRESDRKVGEVYDVAAYRRAIY